MRAPINIACTAVLVILLCALTHDAQAQPFETILAFRTHYHPPTAYKSPERSSGGDFRLLQLTGDITLPVTFETRNGKAAIIGGMLYNRFRFDSISRTSDVLSESFNRMTFKIGASYPWSARHRTNIIFLPTWARQGSIFGSDGFQPGVLAVHSFVVNDRLTLKAGLYYNREFYGNFFMPLLGIDWRLNNGWYIFGLLPGTANVYKKVNDWFAISISERAPTGSLLANESPGDYVVYGRGAYALFMLDLHFTPFRFDLLGNDSDLTFSLSAGWSMLREYELYQDDMVIEAGPFNKIGSGPYLKFMAWVRVWQ